MHCFECKHLAQTPVKNPKQYDPYLDLTGDTLYVRTEKHLFAIAKLKGQP